MLKLATLIENPGEPLIDSKYHDPSELKAIGYNGVVLYPTTALSGIANPDVIASSEYKRWVNSHFQRVDQEINDAVDAGLDVYLFYDLLVLPEEILEGNRQALTCKNRPTTICPASDKAYAMCMQALSAHLMRWPQITGIVVRFGDSDATRLPFLTGNDIYSPYCPRCSSLNKLERAYQAIQSVFDTVVRTFEKRLIVRAWNVRPNGLHDAKELASKLSEKLQKLSHESDERLMVSFKFTNTDFWRYQSWNESSLNMGDIPVVYEFQCQREFEGKGIAPNWQLPLWQNGSPEIVDKESQGLAACIDQVNFAGSLVWVRGGGWGGPFIKNEQWVDANAYAASKLTDNPKLDAFEVACDWVRERLKLSNDDSIKAVSQMLIESSEIIRHAFYIEAYANDRIDGWHPNADWIQDDVLDTEALLRLIKKIDRRKLDDVISEKKVAVKSIAALRAKLQAVQDQRNQSVIEPLVNTVMYFESLVETISHLIQAFVGYRLLQDNHASASSQLVMRHLLTAQNRWNHHTQRVPTLPGSPTPYREKNFWELTQSILSEIQSM